MPPLCLHPSAACFHPQVAPQHCATGRQLEREVRAEEIVATKVTLSGLPLALRDLRFVWDVQKAHCSCSGT